MRLKNNQTKWQAQKCPFSISLNSGTFCEHIASAFGHLVLNLHPEGGLIGDGISPESIILFLVFATEGSEIGIAEIKDCV